VRRLLGLLMLALAAGILVPAASAAAAKLPLKPDLQRFGVRLVDVPVSEEHNPRGLRYIIDFLPPGAVIHRRIMVLNEESRKGHFTVYPDAARIAHGSFTGDAGATRSELTGWITIQHPRLTLRPHTSVMDMVTIRVPRKPTRGEHYGVIWAQQVSRVRRPDGFAIKEIARVGIRIYLAVGPGGVPPTNFKITSITGYRSSRGQPLLAVQVRNTGGRAVDLSGTARLTAGPGGTSAGPFRERQVVTLAPGQSGRLIFAPGRRLPSGPWLATIRAVSGLTARTASATIQFSGHPATTWMSPTAMTGAAGFIGLLIFALLKVRRRALQTRRTQAA